MSKSGDQVSEGEAPQPDAPAAAPQTLRWRSCPVIDDFPWSLLLVATVAGVCVLAGIAFGGVGFALLSAALLGVSLARYFLPTQFELDAQGATVRLLGQARRVPWTRVRRVQRGARGVFLSPFERASRLDSFRGTFLRFAGNADEVVRFVESRMAAGS